MKLTKLEYWVEHKENEVLHNEHHFDKAASTVYENGKRYDKLKDTYSVDSIGFDGITVRQMVHYHILYGMQYKLIWNEMSEDGTTDILTLVEKGKAPHFNDERFNIKQDKILVEFRLFNPNGEMPRVALEELNTHFDFMRYVNKDKVLVPEGFGMRNVDSFEIDEDRGVYVVYLEPTDVDMLRFN